MNIFISGVSIWLIFLPVCILGANKRPNIVIFIADDLGIGDVGCFGNDTMNTPFLDRMARQGVKLTHHLAAASFCSPSRAALLTGRYPIRSGMAPPSTNLLRFFYFLAASGGLPSNETTFGELAKSAGYQTAYIGKWHLGLHKNTLGDNEHSPINQGFDYFYGYPWTNAKDFGQEGVTIAASGFPNARRGYITIVVILAISFWALHKHRYLTTVTITFLIAVPVLLLGFNTFILNDLTLLNSIMYRNADVIEHPIILQNLTQRFVREGVKYIHETRQNEDPFLLVMSWVHVHTHIVTNPRFTGKSPHGRYGDGVSELDWGVGQILDALDERGLGENTFAYFTSDNGGHLEEKGARGQQDGGWNGVYKGGKTHGAVEGGIRVPTIVRWPARIPPNTATHEPTVFMDVFPTLANIMGVQLPQDRVIDGRDFMPLLSRKELVTKQKFLVHYCGNEVHAVRYRPDKVSEVWKLVFKTPNYLEGTQECMFFCTCYNAITLDPPYLYDLTTDPGESSPIDYSENKILLTITEQMKTMLEEHKKTIVPVTNQFSFFNLVWKPHLQPSCGVFPFGSCREGDS